MRAVPWAICIPLIFGILYYIVSAQQLDAPKAVRIVTPINHTFRLELDELKSILENDNIKDRHVVVVSIAGAYRQGKSFLLNFFVKYLNAQVNSCTEITSTDIISGSTDITCTTEFELKLRTDSISEF